METESTLSTPQPEPATQSDASPSTDRRKSGRVTRRPELYSQSYSASNGATPRGAKRKRAATGDSNDEGEMESGSKTPSMSSSMTSEMSGSDNKMSGSMSSEMKPSEEMDSSKMSGSMDSDKMDSEQMSGDHMGGEMSGEMMPSESMQK